MSVGVWEPKSAKTVGVTKDRLIHLAVFLDGKDLSDIAAYGDQLSNDAELMKLEAAAWAEADSLSDDQLVTLIRFFTQAEMTLAGWEGGNKSPVIPLVRILKSRGGFEAELRKWIKSTTDNRYLPYGSAL